MFKRIALVSLPSMELERPPAAIGILAGISKSMECDTAVFDFNLRFYNDLDAEEWNRAEKFWRLRQPTDEKLQHKIDTLWNKYINEIKQWAPDLMAVSVFTLMSNKAALEFLTRWHQLVLPSPCIVVGGQGITTPYQVGIEKTHNVLQVSTDLNFGQYLYQQNLINHYVIGDGEDAFFSILKGNFDHPGIDGQPSVQLENLDNYSLPDYTLNDPRDYKYTQHPGVYVTASRGCIRKCTFCDVPNRWPKFKYRKGKNVALEIFTHWQRHGVKIFQLTDSVVNGNLREFLDMNSTLAEYQEQNAGMDIKLLGQFNIRDPSLMTEEQYRTMAQAGWRVLIPGVESGSERIRFEMGKDFTNADIDWHFYQCAKWGIQNVVLMFVGYPSETLEDHQENLRFLETYQKYMHTGTILMIRWGYTGSLDVGSQLSFKDLNLNIVPQIPDLDLTHLLEHDQYWIYGRNWINLNNPTLTFEERIRRRLELHQKSIQLGWPVTRPKEELLILQKIVEQFKGINSVNNNDPIFTEIGDH
jgi:hypothetical protein